MRSLSVTTIRRMSSNGRVAQHLVDAGRGGPGVIQSPRARRKMWLYSWQAWPTVGV